MTKESALSLIQASLLPEATMKFHSDSRKPFDYEQPVIDAAKEALGGKGFTKFCTTKGTMYTETQMLLTDDEVELINTHRTTQAFYQARTAKRKACTHDWSYRGEWRGESSYECYQCGGIKWG